MPNRLYRDEKLGLRDRKMRQYVRDMSGPVRLNDAAARDPQSAYLREVIGLLAPEWLAAAHYRPASVDKKSKNAAAAAEEADGGNEGAFHRPLPRAAWLLFLDLVLDQSGPVLATLDPATGRPGKETAMALEHEIQSRADLREAIWPPAPSMAPAEAEGAGAGVAPRAAAPAALDPAQFKRKIDLSVKLCLLMLKRRAQLAEPLLESDAHALRERAYLERATSLPALLPLLSCEWLFERIVARTDHYCILPPRFEVAISATV